MQHKNIKRSGFRFKWLTVILLSTFMAITSGGYWLVNTTPGLQWLLSAAERISGSTIQFEGVDGTIGALQIETLRYHDESLQFAVHQFKLDWSIDQLFSGKLHINDISARLVVVYTSPTEDEDETALPDDLTLPLEIALKQLQVDEIHIYSIGTDQTGQQSHQSRQPDFSLTDLSIQLESHAQQHRLVQLSFNSILGALNASGQILAARPFKLESTILLDNSGKWGQTQVTLNGSLERVDINLEHHNKPMQATIVAQVQPFATSAISLVTSLEAAITEFNPAALFPGTPDIPKANLALHATLGQNAENQLAGQLTLKNHAFAPLDQDGLPIAEINSAVLFTGDELKLDNLQILLSEKGKEGILSGSVAWRFDPASGIADLNVSSLNPAAITTQLQAAKISGLAQVTADADRLNAEIRLSDQTLKLDASVTHTASQVRLEHFNLSHGQSSLTGTGELNLDHENPDDHTQPFHFTGQLRQFNIADFLQAPVSNLNTRLTVTGHLSPEFSGLLDYQFEKSHLNHQPVSGKGNIAVQLPLSVTSKADFQIGSNYVGIHGKFGKPGNALAVNITAPSLAQIGLGLSGFLKAQIDLKGTLDSPAVDFDIDSEKLTLPGNHAIDNFAAKGKVHSEALSLLLTANQLRTDGETRVKQLNLKINGTQSSHTIQTDLRVDDEMTVTLQADGGIQQAKKPDALPGWQGQLAHLAITGLVPVELQAPMPLKLGTEQISIRNAQFKVAGGKANIETIFWSPENWKSSGHFSGIRLHPDSDLIPTENLLQLGGRWAMQSTASLAQLNGDIEITREKGDWYLPGELPQPAGLQTLKLHAKAQNGMLTGQFELDSAQIGTAKAQLKLPIIHTAGGELLPPQTRLDGQLNLQAPDLSWLDQVTDNAIQTGGQIKLHASVAGSLGKPELRGTINGDKLAIALLDVGVNLHQGQLSARFDQSALHIDQLSFLSPHEPPPKDRLLRKLELEDKPGSLNVTGSLGFKENTHQLTVSLDRLYLVHPPHYWIVASGKSKVQFINNVLDLGGDIIADAGLITQPPAMRPQLAGDIIIVDDKSELANKSNTDEQGTIVNLHASLDLGKQFFLRVAGLEGRLDGKLHLQNDEKQALSVVGSIATRQTTYKAYGQDLTVERGIVNFHGPIDDPGLNILAKRKDLEVEAGVEVAGSVRHPKVKLVSTPNVPDTEKLSWIVLGRAPDTSGLDTSLLITAASSIFGGDSGGITGQLSDMLGVDEISFRQGSTPGSTQTTGTGIPGPPLTSPVGLASSALSGQIGTIGKRLSSRAYLSYERGITTTTAGITKLTYSLTPKITVVTQAGEDSAVDMFYTFRFD
ncbi:MAG: translocation/assembly module TamB domain-containing protein [Nitrosomonas sp.]|nr:translocation/assembly module TamB domain-containing protein [Nitrosomonas sp.]